MVIINTIIPVFLIVSLGALIRQLGLVSVDFFRDANRLTYYIGLPALLFSQLSTTFPSIVGVKPLVITMLSGTLLTVICAYAIGLLIKVPLTGLGTFVQGAFRGNLVFVGLPILFALPDMPLSFGLRMHQVAILTIAPVMLLYNILGIVVLLLGQQSFSRGVFISLLRQLATSPIIISIVVGMTFSYADWHVPEACSSTFRLLWEMALPVGLLGIGGMCVEAQAPGKWKATCCAALIKVSLSPAIGWLCGKAWGLDPLAIKVVMILMAAPTATVSYSLASELKGDPQMASGIILCGVLISILTLAGIVGWV